VKSIWASLFIFLCVVLCSAELPAQSETDGGNDNQGQAARPSTSMSAARGEYPPLPVPFFRGNDPRFVGTQGFYPGGVAVSAVGENFILGG